MLQMADRVRHPRKLQNILAKSFIDRPDSGLKYWSRGHAAVPWSAFPELWPSYRKLAPAVRRRELTKYWLHIGPFRAIFSSRFTSRRGRVARRPAKNQPFEFSSPYFVTTTPRRGPSTGRGPVGSPPPRGSLRESKVRKLTSLLLNLETSDLAGSQRRGDPRGRRSLTALASAFSELFAFKKSRKQVKNSPKIEFRTYRHRIRLERRQ
jgi:hypothetical protein